MNVIQDLKELIIVLAAKILLTGQVKMKVVLIMIVRLNPHYSVKMESKNPAGVRNLELKIITQKKIAVLVEKTAIKEAKFVTLVIVL